LLGYAIGYAYQCGYLAHFGVSSDFARVSLQDTLIALAALIASVGGVFWLFNFLFILVDALKPSTYVRFSLLRVAIIAFTVLLAIRAARIEWNTAWPFLFLPVFVAFLEFTHLLQ